MKTMKYNAMILVAIMLMISMNANAAYKHMPMQSTSAMQMVGSTHDAQVREAYAPDVTYHILPMLSTSTMMETGDIPTPFSDEEENRPKVRRGFINPSDPGDQSDEFPIGEPWILLLFAAATAATIAIRQRRHARVRQIALTDAATA